MKKQFPVTKSVFAAAAIALTGAATINTSTQPTHAQTRYYAAPISVLLNGRAINLGGVAPMQAGGRVLVPLRGVFESLGATVNYDAPTSTIYATRGATNVRLRLGSTQADVNGETRYLDVPAQSRFGRTFVPLRFVSETLGAQVQWAAAQRTVYITQGDDNSVPVDTVPIDTTPGNTVPGTGAYPTTGFPAGQVVTITGTVTRNLPGERRFEITTDSGYITQVRTQDAAPAGLTRGDRVRLSGQMVNNVFEAETARVIRNTNRRERTEGTVVSVLSATRLTLRTDDNRVLTVVTTQPFDAAISPGDRVRVPGVVNDDFITGERVVVLTDAATSVDNSDAQAVSFSGTVESVDTVARVLQVRGDNGQPYLVRYNGASTFRRDDRVRVVGTYANDITTASSVTRE